MTARSYAMSWQLGDGPREAGRVEVTEQGLDLESSKHMQRIRFTELSDVRLSRGFLRIERRAKPPLVVASLDGPGALRELADRLVMGAHLPG